MTLSVECPECFQTYTVPEKLVGKKIKCKSCSAPMLVGQAETLSQLPPRSSQSQTTRSKSSSSRKKPKRSKPSGGPAFSLSSIDSPMGYLIIAIIIMTLWFFNMPTGQGSGVINGLLAMVVLALGSRMKYLARRGEGGIAVIVLVTLIAIGILGFVYKLRLDIEAGKKGGGRTEQNQASDEKSHPVLIPRDVTLPAGTKLILRHDMRTEATTLKDSNIGEEDVQIRFDEHPDVEISYSRSDLMIRSDVLHQIEEDYKATFDPVAANRASVARAQQAKVAHLPDPNAVVLPTGFPIPEGLELYHRYQYKNTKYEWYQVSVVSWIEDKVMIQYLENDTEHVVPVGFKQTVPRSELYIDRDRLAALREPEPVPEAAASNVKPSTKPATSNYTERTYAVVPRSNIKLLPPTPCTVVTPEGAFRARIVKQLSRDEITVESYSQDGLQTHTVSRADLRIPEVWIKYLVAFAPEHMRPPLEKTPWFMLETPADPAAFVDLTKVSNRKLYEPVIDSSPLNTLEDLRPGYYNMGGTEFHITGHAVQLNSTYVTAYRNEIRIPVGRTAGTIAILHSSLYGGVHQRGNRFNVDEGATVGEIRLEYESLRSKSVPIVYAGNLREWFSVDDPEATDAELAWTGDNAFATQKGLCVRLYKFTFENPHPDAKITNLVYQSNMKTVVAPFCVAITLEE